MTPTEELAYRRRRAAEIERRCGQAPPHGVAAGRRRFLQGTGALAASGTLIGGGSSGCDPGTTLSVALLAIKLVKSVFSIVEEIRGSFEMQNPSDRSANIEVISELLTGDTLSDVVETFSCVVSLAGGGGPMMVDWCSGVRAQDPGTHLVQAQEGGNDPVESDEFEVEPA